MTTTVASQLRLENLTKTEKLEEIKLMENVPYASVMGLMYATTGSRPDLAFAVVMMSLFVSSPWREHWAAVKLDSHIF